MRTHTHHTRDSTGFSRSSSSESSSSTPLKRLMRADSQSRWLSRAVVCIGILEGDGVARALDRRRPRWRRLGGCLLITGSLTRRDRRRGRSAAPLAITPPPSAATRLRRKRVAHGGGVEVGARAAHEEAEWVREVAVQAAMLAAVGSPVADGGIGDTGGDEGEDGGG